MMENLTENWDDLGVPLFRRPPNMNDCNFIVLASILFWVNGKKYTGKRPQTVWGVGTQCTRYKQQ